MGNGEWGMGNAEWGMERSQSSRLKAQSKEEKKKGRHRHTQIYTDEGRGMMGVGGRRSEVGRWNGEFGIRNCEFKASEINQSIRHSGLGF